MVDNLANAVLIIGASYLMLVHGLNPIVWILMILGGALTWQMSADESREYLKAQTEYYKAKTRALETNGRNHGIKD